MGRPKIDVPTADIAFSTTARVRGLLKQLVAQGLHGKSVNEAAERLVCRALEDMIATGRLKEDTPDLSEKLHGLPPTGTGWKGESA